MSERTSGGYWFAGHPKWLFGHLLVLAAGVSMVLLGHWQLTVSSHKGFSLQNFGYAIQWWLFTAFALAFWAKILRDNARSRQAARAATVETAEPVAVADESVAYRRYVMPQSADGPPQPSDDAHAAYNAYLASLALDPKNR